jgi:phage tail sheath gpL-like
MTSPISIGVPTEYPVPGDFLQINFGVGPGGADQGAYGVLIVANKTTAGSGTVDTVVYGPNSTPSLQTETDVITLAGSGSEAHRMWLRVRSVFDLAATLGVTPPPIYMVFPTESVGGQASLDSLIANTSTAASVLRYYCEDDFVDVQITNGQTVNSIGAALVAAINNQTRWPITAGFNTGTGVMTVTAKQHGPRGNEIRVWAVFLQPTASTIANNVSTPLAGGTTEDSWTTALATIFPVRYFYTISPSTNVSGTNFDDLVAQVAAQSAPLIGNRQRVFAGYIGTQSGGSTIAATLNTELCEIAWLQTPELTAGEIAAKVAAIHAVFEDFDWSWNFRAFGSGKLANIDTAKFWGVPAPQTRANWPTQTSIATALNNGLTAIDVTRDGRTFITRTITTRHKNGSNFDYRVRDSSIVSVTERWADEVLADWSSAYGASKIINDQNAGEPVPGPRVVQPKQMLALVYGHIDAHANKNLKNANSIKLGTQIVRDPNNLQRVGVRIPTQVIDLLLQTEFEIDDNSTASS